MRTGEIVLFSVMAGICCALVLTATRIPEEERPSIVIEEVD
jgi:hypothetical protein